MSKNNLGLLSQGDGFKSLTLMIFRGYLDLSLTDVIEFCVTNNRGYKPAERKEFTADMFIDNLPRIEYADCRGVSYQDAMEIDVRAEIPKGLKKESNDIEEFNLFLNIDPLRRQGFFPIKEIHKRIPMFANYEDSISVCRM